MLVYWLDIVGTAVFAISGVLLAGKLRMDPFGVLVLGVVTAVGGGTIRDMALDHGPVFWVKDPTDLVVAMVTSMLTIVLVRQPRRLPKWMLPVLDAVGLAVFVGIGVNKAFNAEAGPLIAGCMGVMLAVAGCIIQRLTGNPMASPEVLGISSGAAFGVVLMLFLVPGNAFGWLLPAGSLGAAVTLLIIMIAAGRGGFSPHRMLLAGMALSTAFTMLLMMLQASGDPRMAQVLTWISGSTYNATDAQVWRTGIVMVILLAITPLCRRWLTILPLGGDTARAVGMALTPTRIALLLLAACLTATATMTIGPLSFVGLMAPHIARMMGFRRTMPHIVISALVGGLLLVFADWCGRMVLFPFQIPAGLLSTFIGAPYFIYLLRKQSR